MTVRSNPFESKLLNGRAAINSPLPHFAPVSYIDLPATLPIMTCCIHRGGRLLPERDLMVARLAGTLIPAEPVDAAVVALDRYTYQGLTTGRVGLPGRDIHVSLWFRLLRTLLAELGEAPSQVGGRSAMVLQLIWQATGQPQRGGFAVWQPYEYLDWPCQ